MLWLCARLSHPGLDRLARPTRGAPLALSVQEGGCERVFDADQAARNRGIRPGMPVSAAFALAPGLIVRGRDEAGERALLERLAAWARQFTDRVCLGGDGVLLLEIGGSLSLFGGLEPLVGRIGTGLETLGYRHVLATAPTPLAAEWLARSGMSCHCPQLEGLPGLLGRLPASLAAPDEHERLAATGLTRLRDLLALPRAPLARRFGPELVERLAQALGERADPRTPVDPPAGYRAELELPAETDDASALLFAVRRLLEELAGVLRGRCAAVQHLEISLDPLHGASETVEVGFARPVRGVDAMLAVVREHLEGLTLQAPVAGLVLTVARMLPAEESAGALFETPETGAVALDALLDRLRARLGEDAVRGLAPADDHRPERAWRSVRPGAVAVSCRTAGRPLWLLPAPRRLAVRDGRPCLAEDAAPLALLSEPERIESGWWDGADAVRDYYPAVDLAGARLWVFRDRRGSWYLHGLFA